MPAAIGPAIARMLATIEPLVRSFIEGLAQRVVKNTRCWGTALVRARGELLCSGSEPNAVGQSQRTPSPPRPGGPVGGLMSRRRGDGRPLAVPPIPGRRILRLRAAD